MAQTRKNHRRFYPLFHFFQIPLGVAGLIFAIIHLAKAPGYQNALITLVFVVLLVSSLTARLSALRAQDRAIRNEVALRYFILTGKPLPTELRLSQIIALRFAKDEECGELTARAVAEKLSSKEIKQAIKDWKEDRHRV